MGKEACCPQCAGTLNEINRLVQDACGHKKCRSCLLKDESTCKQCAEESNENENKTARKIDCHTAVITYQKNVFKKKFKIVPKVFEVAGTDGTVDENECKNDIADTDNKQKVPDTDQNNKKEFLKFSNEETKVKPKFVKKVAVSSSHISFNAANDTYTCSFCKKSFSGNARVKYHKYCNGEKRPFVCDICDRGFLAKSHYTTHRLSHQKLKPYKCTAAGCGKTFSERSKLNRHKSTHDSNRPFVCQECGKSFKIKENLRTHMLIHKNEKPYACTECNLGFSHSSNLKKHLAVHTNIKAHMCDQCGKRYKLKWALTLHRRVHAKVRPNKCSTCNKTFVHLKDLNRHELIHVDNKGYRCGLCNAAFRRKDNLRRHARTTHPGEDPQIIKCVDTPNAIKVITAPPPPTVAETALLPEREVLLHIPESTLEVPIKEVVVTPQIQKIEENMQQSVHVPVKLAFKTLQFRNHYKMNNDFIEPKSENVSIYEKIMKPRSETRTSTITQTLPNVIKAEATDNEASIFEPNILTPFNAPAHYETSFDNKKHAVIKNIKFKLPDKYINLNMMRRKPTTDGDIATTSVIVNSGNTHQFKVV